MGKRIIFGGITNMDGSPANVTDEKKKEFEQAMSTEDVHCKYFEGDIRPCIYAIEMLHKLNSDKP